VEEDAMFRSTLRNQRARGVVSLAVIGLTITGCAPLTARPDGLYVTPIGNAPVTTNSTPYSLALTCLRDYAGRSGRTAPHIAVGRIADLTGKLEDNGGRAVTQGAPLMAMSALAKAGVPLVERYETDVSRVEYKLADNKLISDAPLDEAGPDGRRPYRPIFAGTMSGSDYFLTGGITELNANLHTGGANLTSTRKASTVQFGSAGASDYVLNIALDLRLVNTKTLDVVDVVSYQKQIVGRQVGAELFAFFGNNVVSVTGTNGGEEPVHLAVRSLIERAVLEMMGRMYDLPATGACLASGGDPLGDTPQVVAAIPDKANPEAAQAKARLISESDVRPVRAPEPAPAPARMLRWPSHTAR
jgi:curli biogenesis system outer membrane secretion channel CsgG